MTHHAADLPLAQSGAKAIAQAFDDYHSGFKAITRRAKSRFEERDWQGVQRDAVERLDLRERVVNQAVADVRAWLGAETLNKSLWAGVKNCYSTLIAGRDDFELAETFFNSVTRRIFTTVGVDPSIEYAAPDFKTRPLNAARPIYKVYPRKTTTRDLIKEILADYAFRAPYQDLEEDAALAAEEIDRRLRGVNGTEQFETAEIARPVFYRNKGAFLIGRLRRGARLTPLVLALLNPEPGVVVDAALMTESEVSIVFSFTRSYFHVEVERPSELIKFLKTLMPRKRVAELYISIGHHKHGKTELYRELMHHLSNFGSQFELARGDRGMVMVVFTLPSFNVVFKIIRDQFSYPKTTTRREVMDKYQLVFKHDRAGRLVDAQEFEHLQFGREHFSDELLEELKQGAPDSVVVDGDSVVVKHLYVERRLTPLNLYLREAGPEAASEAIMDYGQSIKDMAATNIFPGDLLLKNFGVTRHGRVVFYDYDEVCPLTDCNFREMPQASSLDEEMDAEPWFYVGPNDIFPEEFLPFLGLQGDVKEIFLRAHGDLLRAAFWTQMQAQLRAGEVMDVFAYRQSKRLRRNAG